MVSPCLQRVPIWCKCNIITICKIDSQWEFAIGLREFKLGLCNKLEGRDGERDGREVQEGGAYVFLWMIHVDIWQKPTEFYKAIILQLKNKFKIKNKCELDGIMHSNF